MERKVTVMPYQRCTRCIMDNATDSSITFDNEGHCNYCTDVMHRKPAEYFPNEEGRRRLDDIIARIKAECKNDPYDCMVGVSGGIDSSFILYLGYQYGLRMFALHVDDGLDNPIATENIQKLLEKTGTEYASIVPNRTEYADILRSLFKASVQDLAIVQDNLILKGIQDYGEKMHIRYSLDGLNFAHESILEHGIGVNANDKKYILGIQKRFGKVPIKELRFNSMLDRYVWRHASAMKHIRPLNYLNYNLEEAIRELNEFCGFKYYGGKHYESILTRFMQCYYLPVKFGVDKRKSHYSSLIMSGQMTREEALLRMEQPLYPTDELLEFDKQYIADYIGVTMDEFEQYLSLPPKSELMYPHSLLNEVAPMARKFRKWIE